MRSIPYRQAPETACRCGWSEWSILTDFELRPTSGRPALDNCQNNVWRENYPSLSFTNQGDCIAAIVAQN